VRPQFSTAEFAALNKNQRNKELLQKLQVMIICADASKRKRNRKEEEEEEERRAELVRKCLLLGKVKNLPKRPPACCPLSKNGLSSHARWQNNN
jgi:hypothetical protein